MNNDQAAFLLRQQARIERANRQRAKAGTVTVLKTATVGESEGLPQALRGLGLDRAFTNHARIPTGARP